MDFFIKSDIANSIDRIEKLLECGIFNQENARHILMRSAFTELMVHVSDLMKKAEQYTERVNFQDDIAEGDVTDLITKVRNALCHISSDEHKLDAQSKISFNVAFGKCNIMKLGDTEITSEYDDDTCFIFGRNSIYLKRHIIRATNIARKSFVDKKFVQNNRYGSWQASPENSQHELPVA